MKADKNVNAPSLGGGDPISTKILSLELFRASNLSSMLETAACNCAWALQAPVFAVLVRNGHELVVEAGVGFDLEKAPTRRLDQGESISGSLLVETRAMNIPSATEYASKLPRNLEPYYKGPLLSVPILMGEEPKGLVNACRSSEGHPFSDEELQCLVHYAELFAFIIASYRTVNSQTEEMKRQKKRLEQSEHRLRTLFQQAQNPIFGTDDQGNFLSANKAALRFFECSKSELLLHNFWDLCQDEAVSLKEKRSFFLRHQTTEVLFEINNQVKKLLLNIAPTDSRKKDFVYVIGYDITEESFIEESRTKDHFRALIENASDVIMILDTDRTVRYASPAVNSMLNRSPSEVCGRDGCELIDPDDKETFIEAFDKALVSPHGVCALEIGFSNTDGQTPDGQTRTIELTLKNMFDNPAVGGIVVNFRDVTLNRHLEDQLRHSQRMEAVGQLAGGVAHDFNNLLAVILGYSDLLLRQLRKDDPLRTELGEINRAGQRAASLVRQLLAFSSKQMLKPEILDLNEVVRSLDKMLSRVIGEDVAIVTSLEDRLGKVRIDPAQIEQVLMNLAINAREAMPRGGTLTFRTANKKLDSRRVGRLLDLDSGDYVLVEVKDTGIGMDLETQQRMFEPFFTTKGRGRGSGLGLSTIYGIIKQSGGCIEVDSVLQQGTAFTIYLPRIEGIPHRRFESQQLTAAQGGTETILLVEDDDMVREMFGRALLEGGYKVLHAADGQEALRVAHGEAGRIHLLIIDVGLPVLSGYDVALRFIRDHPDTRVIFMSGYLDTPSIPLPLMERICTFLQKPFTPAALMKKAREFLDA